MKKVIPLTNLIKNLQLQLVMLWDITIHTEIHQFMMRWLDLLKTLISVICLLMVMENANAVIPKPKPVKVYFAAMGEQPRLAAFGLVQKLRENGVFAEFDHMERSFKAQFKYANKIFAEYVAILGDDELAAGAAKIKCMADGFETSVKLDELVDYFAD